MKSEFDEWWDKTTFDFKYYSKMKNVKRGWTAALEWTMKMFRTNLLNPPPIYNVKEEIEEELKNLED